MAFLSEKKSDLYKRFSKIVREIRNFTKTDQMGTFWIAENTWLLVKLVLTHVTQCIYLISQSLNVFEGKIISFKKKNKKNFSHIKLSIHHFVALKNIMFALLIMTAQKTFN